MSVDVATTMSALLALTTNFVSVIPAWSVTADDMEALATWVAGTNDQYVMWIPDSDTTAASDSPSVFTGFGNWCLSNPCNGTAIVRTFGEAGFGAGMIASINWAAPNGRINFSFKASSVLTPSTTDGTSSENLEANGYNFYGIFGNGATNTPWFYPGQIAKFPIVDTPVLPNAPFGGIAQYVDAIWLDSNFTANIADLFSNVDNVPDGPAGYAMIKLALKSTIDQALLNGVIVPNTPLTGPQIVAVNTAAGLAIDKTLATKGWYLQVIKGAPGSPIGTFWYTDGGAVNAINLVTADLQ